MNKDEMYYYLKDHPRLDFIKYDKEPHTYHYFPNGDFRKTSEAVQFGGVTSIIGKFKQPFNAKKQAKASSKNPYSKWHGMSEKDILASWKKKGDDARNEGDIIHDTLEDFVNKGVWEDEFEVVYQLYENALTEAGLTPVYSEFLIFDEDLQIASMIDDLALTQDNKLTIIDKKSYADGMEYSAYGNKSMLPPFDHLQDSKYNHVCLQTGIYKKILKEKYTDLPVADEKYCLRITREEAELIALMPMETEVNKLLEYV